MNKSLIIKPIVFSVVVCFAIGTLSGCSMGGSNTAGFDKPSTSAVPKTAGGSATAVAGKKVFSSLNELNYTPNKQTEYKIGPNDLLLLDVFRVEELSREVRVTETGTISLPLIGTMKVVGLSQQQLEKLLANKLAKSYLQNPQVSVSVKEFTSKEVTVAGSVKTPGVFPIKGEVTLSQAVALAGGLVPLADPEAVVLFRPKNDGTFKAYNVNLVAIRDGKIRDPYLNGKDQVVVHESGSRVWLGRVINTVRGILSPVRL